MTNDKLADEPLIAKGISRLADAGRTVGIAFNRRPTDDELRKIHDLLHDPAALRAERPQSGEIKKALDTALYALGYVAEFAGDGGDHTKADGKAAERAAKVIRAWLAAAEAERGKT